MELTPYTSTMGLSGLRLQFAIAGIATCAFWLFGYDMSVMGGVITEEPFLSVFPETLNATVQGIVIATLELGALAGAIICIFYGDRWGRRGTVFIGMAFMVVGGILQTSAWHIAQMVVGRLLSGIGLGLQVATVPAWQSECAKPKSRGRWVMIEGGLPDFRGRLWPMGRSWILLYQRPDTVAHACRYSTDTSCDRVLLHHVPSGEVRTFCSQPPETAANSHKSTLAHLPWSVR